MKFYSKLEVGIVSAILRISISYIEFNIIFPVLSDFIYIRQFQYNVGSVSCLTDKKFT